MCNSLTVKRRWAGIRKSTAPQILWAKMILHSHCFHATSVQKQNIGLKCKTLQWNDIWVQGCFSILCFSPPYFLLIGQFLRSKTSWTPQHFLTSLSSKIHDCTQAWVPIQTCTLSYSHTQQVAGSRCFYMPEERKGKERMEVGWGKGAKKKQRGEKTWSEERRKQRCKWWREGWRALRSGGDGGGRRGGMRNKNKERGGCIIRVCDGGFSLTPHVV